jgi:ABC-type sugar transport system ATPase subunit
VLLELRNIQKRFGGVIALRDGCLSAERGQVHLLLGENGAGKSTLMKIAAGILPPDAGRIVWQGREVRFARPAEAAANGIAMVHQESLLAPHLSVAENIFLGREPRLPLGFVSRRRMRDAAARLIEEHRFPLQPDWTVARLNPAGRQLVEICRAIQHGSSLLIFDEPTSSLSDSETREVFRIVRSLCERNVAVIYITHRLEELRSVGDAVTVLRDGETVHTGPLEGLPTDRIIRLMVGREVASIFERQRLAPGAEMLRVEALSRKPLLREIAFSLHAGEIVGLAGLVGAGRTELCRALFGIDAIDGGRITVAGREVRIRSPRDAVQAGLALIPEDRQGAGLATRLPLVHNLTAANLRAVSRFGVLDGGAERAAAGGLMERFRIRAAGPRQIAGRLSGGNQQKAVIAKWLYRQARVFLFDEPARGIDVAAKAEVFALMDELARGGAAILMVSSELPELLQVADRILVMRQGRIAAALEQPTTQEAVMRHAIQERAG